MAVKAATKAVVDKVAATKGVARRVVVELAEVTWAEALAQPEPVELPLL